MGEMITKYVLRKTMPLWGTHSVGIAENKNAGSSSERISGWFTPLEDRSIFSLRVGIFYNLKIGAVEVIVQTDFDVYPYADADSRGGVNEPKFIDMITIARKNCVDFVNPKIQEYGYKIIEGVDLPEIYNDGPFNPLED
jgi:hypothetical protein